MNIRRVFCGVVVGVAAASLGFAATPTHAQTQLRLGHVNSPDSPTGQGIERFAELVENYTNGEVTVDVYPSSQLGNNRKLMGQVRSGAIQLAITPYPILADIVPEYSAYTAGYFYDNWSQVARVVEHPELGHAWNATLAEEGGLEVLATYYYGARNLTTTDTEVTSPADVDGLKIRAVPNEMSLAVVSGLGGAPTPVAFAELFQALRQGVVDGQENPLPTIWANKFYDVQDYVILTGHQIIPIPIVANLDAWNELSEDERAAIRAAAGQAASWMSVETIHHEASLAEQLEEAGATVIGPEDGLDIDAFREAVRASVLAKFDGPIWPDGVATQVLEVAHQ